MIQTENRIENKSEPRQADATLTKTRCPGCKRLFAVETETLAAMSRAGVYRAEFTCTAELCRVSFAIELPLPEGHSGMGVLPSVRLDPVARVESRESTPEGRPSADEAVQEAPAQSHQSAMPAPLKTERGASLLRERECPRCGAMNQAAQSDCVRCGIVFERYDKDEDEHLSEEMALGGTRELAALWGKTLEDYEDRIRHDRFLNACRDADALSYAAKKYSQILVAAPQDDIARLMRNRIVAMVSVKAESSKLPIRLNFRIPGFNTMGLFLGALLFFWGLAMPQIRNLMEIGLSMLLLSIGVRLALRSRV
ncbi:MAG: hypothetical protein RBT63_05885 [Bdellovibrionales bacterium]|jgi:hypothetical protein|nr:hypothetical protein [Bdellovibrionales bacterium]